ncbi:MAG: carboxylating nicotinate-nucleotide diphosphorylase [Gammaproteobacteria bacterium]|nr:carboxylating nicotinate-nucleotide diphosphorylase [Gammaproteobacteria bacterium]
MQHRATTPPPEVVEANVRAALAEDVGEGDVTAELVERGTCARAVVVSRSSGVFCGAPWVVETFRQVDPGVRVDRIAEDGARMSPDETVMEFSGAARSLLTAERTILNFAQLLSGTATRASAYAQAVAGTKAEVLDTRKTIPGLRAAQKYAAAVGGIRNHRAGLFDAYLIKENHIAAAGGIAVAVRRARSARPDLVVEVEVEDLDQLDEALVAAPDIVLLDNFSHGQIREAVRRNASRVKIEVSGGIHLADAASIARLGVDYISVGDITKHVEPLDLSMRFG